MFGTFFCRVKLLICFLNPKGKKPTDVSFYFSKLIINFFAPIFLVGCGEIVSSLEYSRVIGFDLRWTSRNDISAGNIGSYPVAGRCVPQYNDVTVEVGSPVLASQTFTCNNGLFSGAIDLSSAGLPEGPTRIIALQLLLTANAQVQVLKDTIIPIAPVIISPLNGSSTSAASISVTGSCETNSIVNISGDFVGSPVNTACVASGFVRAITLILGNGPKNISATQTDSVGNISPADSIIVNLGILPTVPTIASPIAGQLTNAVAITVTGTCESAATVNISGDVVGAPVTVVCSAGSYSQAVSLTATNGVKTINVSQTNTAGTSPTATININLDTAVPGAPTIVTPANGSISNTLPKTVTGACETGATVNLTGDFSGSPLTAPCVSANYSRAITLTAANGAKSISATQTDPAGNTSSATNISITLDTVTPGAPTITNPLNGVQVSTTAQTVSGACETGATVNLAGSIVGSPVTTACVASAYSQAVTLTAANGSKTINASQTDPAGNISATTSISFIYSNLNVTYPAMFTGLKYTPLNDPLPGVAPTVVSGTPTGYAITPALPTGLSFNTSTGLISGTATVSDDVGTLYTITITDAVGSIQRTIFLRIAIPDYTWMGTAGDGLWNTAANWRINAVPPSTAYVYFDNECQASGFCNANININAQVTRVYMKPTYTGTITQLPGFTFGVGTGLSTSATINSWGKWEMEAGTFVGGNSSLILDRLNIIGGSFTSTSSTLTLGSVFTEDFCEGGLPLWEWKGSRDCGFTLSSSGTFNHNNGTVYVNSSTNTDRVRVFAFYADQQINLYNLIMDNNSNGPEIRLGRKVNAASKIWGTNKIVNVSNSFEWRDGDIDHGEIRFQGLNAVFLCDNAIGGDRCSDLHDDLRSAEQPSGTQRVGVEVHTWVRFNRSDGLGQTYTFDDGAAASGFIIDNPNGVTPIPTNPPVGYFRIGRLLLSQGTFVAPRHLSFGEGTDTGLSTSGTGISVAGGLFAHNNGLVSFDSITESNSTQEAMTISAPSPGITFNDVDLNIAGDADVSSPATPDNYRIRLGSGHVVNILGDLNIRNGAFVTGRSPLGIINVSGDLNFLCADISTKNCYGTSNLMQYNLIGNTNTQLYFEPGGTGRLGELTGFRINKTLASNRVTLIGNGGLGNISTTPQPFIIANGIFDLGTNLFYHRNNFINNGAVQCTIGTGYFQFQGGLSGAPQGGNQPMCYGP